MQHNGLEFRYDSHLSVWLNDQPLIGIDPGLLPNKQPHPVEAVAGACLLMQRHVFESIGGWESGYLIGDFEDSDLCLTLRSRGLTCFLDPRVTLTHLERQSFAEIGDNSFRTK
jgi:GT2 family glycosyltransferase